ncbi:hypothetical protein TRAPUB_6296 [Trametes pubescens]|uniref:Uncharacterized protein n=1 Tax=Trametes pubescens TaxID=154538 RepID=A0A1M2V675_TRAPU|nr:hypothetical protein TRAPUB_6296 [Trametes pubescens]
MEGVARVTGRRAAAGKKGREKVKEEKKAQDKNGGRVPRPRQPTEATASDAITAGMEEARVGKMKMKMKVNEDGSRGAHRVVVWSLYK